jgi:hypothetical protein
MGRWTRSEEEAVGNQDRPQEDCSFPHKHWSEAMTSCKRAGGQDPKKKLWGTKIDLKKIAAFLTNTGLKL